jgi:hypothetical protein
VDKNDEAKSDQDLDNVEQVHAAIVTDGQAKGSNGVAGLKDYCGESTRRQKGAMNFVTADKHELGPLTLIGIGTDHPGAFSVYIELDAPLFGMRAENAFDPGEWYEWIVGAEESGLTYRAVASVELPEDNLWNLEVETLNGQILNRTVQT